MINATITQLPGSEYPWRWALRIRVADSATFSAFIDDLKREIPHRSRKWDGAAKRWMLKEDQIEVVTGLLAIHGLRYEYQDEPQEETPVHRQLPMNREQAARTLYLLPTAPPFVIQAAYKALAKQLHPDAGGSTEQMQRINAAMEILRASVHE